MPRVPDVLRVEVVEKPIEKPGAATRCPACLKPEFVIQAPVNISTSGGLAVVGAIVKCFHCQKMYAVVEGQVVNPRWIGEAEELEAERKALFEAKRKQVMEKPRMAFDEDMRWK